MGIMGIGNHMRDVERIKGKDWTTGRDIKGSVQCVIIVTILELVLLEMINISVIIFNIYVLINTYVTISDNIQESVVLDTFVLLGLTIINVLSHAGIAILGEHIIINSL